MTNQVVKTIKAVLDNKVVDCLAGTINYCQGELSLEPRGGVYGIAIKLEENEKENFFRNHNEKNTSKDNIELKNWITLGDGYYPLYWGKDSNLGFRLFSHIHTRESTGTLQLDSRDYLHNYIKANRIIYGAVLCSDISDCEAKLRDLYPDIFKTHAGEHDYQ